MLDAREARPLTSREISKVIGGILNGVAAHEPDAISYFPDAMKHLMDLRGHADAVSTKQAQLRSVGLAKAGILPVGRPANWMTALVATFNCFHYWCDPAAIAEAVAWTSENLAIVVRLPD